MPIDINTDTFSPKFHIHSFYLRRVLAVQQSVNFAQQRTRLECSLFWIVMSEMFAVWLIAIKWA